MCYTRTEKLKAAFRTHTSVLAAFFSAAAARRGGWDRCGRRLFFCP